MRRELPSCCPLAHIALNSRTITGQKRFALLICSIREPVRKPHQPSLVDESWGVSNKMKLSIPRKFAPSLCVIAQY